MKELRKFISDQLSVWPLASSNFRSLKSLEVKELTVWGLECRVQFNPCRVASSTADTSEKAIAARPCFLCAGNRPPEQFHVKFEGRKGRRYNVQVNPYPIFPEHLVIAREEHIPQAIWHHYPDMMDFTRRYPDWTVFYNGPESGASAPDHLHFQAVPRLMMPLERAVDAFLDAPGLPLATNKDASLYHFRSFATGVFALKAVTSKSLSKLFYRLLCCCSSGELIKEPAFNLYTWFSGGEYRSMVVLRRSVRSHHYSSTGTDHLSISPGAADMAGVFVTPFREDLLKVTSGMLEEMLSEVCITPESEETVVRRLVRTQPKIEVGIVTAPEVQFEIISDGAGLQKVFWRDGRIDYNGSLYDELTFDSVTRSTLFAEPSFIIEDVTIGIGFHWEQKRTLKFAGSLRFIVDGDKIVAVNRIGLENYLLSVISSEMKSTSGLELLKAHAVISRSWALRRIRERRSGSPEARHSLFDVCADDCCQRYQGLTMAVGDNVRRAIDETWGKVLQYEGEICDARYSKCCGGRTERFSTCWEGPDLHYLSPVDDRPSADGRDFCDCEDADILGQVLNDYDIPTHDFYRWEVSFGRDEISEILRESGKEVGTVLSLEPLERGDSGRISRLRITGTDGTLEIGKELAIRRLLSRDCLKSSNFEVSWKGDSLVLKGRGWGHGVGLCQIGAAVMASRGCSFKEILSHYYTDAELTEIYC